VDNTNIGLLGWSNGGSATLATMSDTAFSPNLPVFKAAIAFYPGCGLYNAFGGLAGSTYVPYAPLRLLHGTQDALYQAGACQTRIARAQLLGASAANGNPMDMIVYQGAKHSFDSALMVGGSQNFTTADVNAKIAADAETMAYFDDYLQ
jgi:dienelactone hydrolase